MIEHIFNAVEPKTKKMIASQEFKIEYWKNTKDGYIPPKDLSSDFSKLYYNALVPSDKDKIISKYDDEKLKTLTDRLGNKLLLISGDFWGIQKFIFDGITTSKASKILRSRSAMVQLITYAVADNIKKKFDGSGTLLFGAGKFMILAKEESNYLSKINKIQKDLDAYFLKNFFGQNGFIISSATTTKDKILNQKDMEKDLLDLGDDNDNKKLNKFNLINAKDNDILVDPFEEALKNDDICEFCGKRAISVKIWDSNACNICANEIKLGENLTKKFYVTIFSSDKQENKNDIFILNFENQNYYARLENKITITNGNTFDISHEPYSDYPKWSLNSYVSKYNEDDEEAKKYNESYKDVKKDMIKTFNHYLDKKINGKLKTVSSGLMALKADIDKLGDTFRTLYREDFRKFNRLSREVEFFFSDYITSLVAKRNNVYTVFAGGDDLFVIGEYREIVELAKEIRKEFYNFSLKKTTISMGLVMFKPTTPINFVSEMADEAEKRAKRERDSIDIFGISIKYDEFIEIEKDFDKVAKYLESNKVDTTTFYYHLIELCDMKENINHDIRNAMWKSKLNYIFRRNINRKNNDSEIFTLLNKLIEKGERFKPSIFLKIYNNKDKKKEN